MKAVVMAGGEGSRLRPLTSRRPKPLAPIANRPVMHHIVALLARHGVTEVVATLHYLADEIESYFGDGSRAGVRLSYVVEDTPLGTAGAVKLAEDRLRDDAFVIISGDAMTDLDLTALIQHHRAQGNDATIALQAVSNPLEFGVVITDEHGRITRFLEKPSWGEVFSDTINTGIYVLNPEIFELMEAGGIYDFSKDLFPRMLHEGKRIGGYVIDDYWTDVGNLQQYQQANYDALSGAVKTDPIGTEISEGVFAAEGARIDPTAQITGPVRIGRNVHVGPGASITGPSSIGDNSTISAGAQLERAILWEDVYVGADAQLRDCTIANRTIVKERAAVGEGTVIGERCNIGSGATVRANLKIWPDKTISSGSIVSMSLIYGIKWPGSLFGGAGVSGLANLEITPEYATKLGQAFGTYLRAGQVVMTSRDTHPVSRVMNRCIISGLLSTGIHVQDLRSFPLPLSRFATRAEGDGCVHVRLSPSDANSLLFEFFDRNGINIDKAAERKIENLFFREDFRRTPMDEVGLLDFPTRVLESYSTAFLEALQAKALPRAGFRAAIDYANGNAALVLPRLLNRLNVDTIALNAYFDDSRVRIDEQARERHLEDLREIVLTLKRDLGILVDHDGETFSLVDDLGRIITGNRLSALLTLLVVRNYPDARIAVPVTAPRAIEEIARSYGAEVTRTRSDRRTLMALAERQGKSLAFAGSASYEFVFPEMHPALDALYAAAKVLELLAQEARKLSELVDMLPDWKMASRSVVCPWEHKGRIMRTLINEQRNGNIELYDGLRVTRDNGWVLVLPDASEPAFNVIAEGTTGDTAVRYVDAMAARIEELVAT
ncbi:MAG TPA: mannose-1-phosphate guanyltransferase [Candidatus Baltobacteraceae bacterium]|nr:mannose-1-phosphate guanyltransferase [Candidatus Baltobacteraceae bacterium]